MVKLGHIALDGTKIKANASKHKAMSYKRMKEEEARLEAEITDLLRKAEVTDTEEDRRYGKNKRGDELPQELAFREGRLKKIREAREALEVEAKQEAEKNGKKDDQSKEPKDKAQRNFTDPESHIPFKDGPPEYVGEVIASLGIDNESIVVIYDNGADFRATRVFWTLSFHGLEKVYVLNGGLEKWRQ